MPLTTVLGDLPVDDFLSRYWQQQPVFIPGALQGIEWPVNQDEIAGLAMETHVESRLVLEADWQVESGPFSEARLRSLPDKGWSLLVQAVDLWVEEVAGLRSLVSFLPDWRFDDVMFSLAPRGGSVGPHYDFYDVFLLQAEGSRHWQIGQHCDGTTALVSGTPLKVLEQMDVTAEYTAEPGDVLYIPPRVAHHGVALDDCMTISIGFRAPALSDLLGDLATEIMAEGRDAPLADPPLTAAMAGNPIDPAFVRGLQATLRSLADDHQLLAEWYARFMTRPRYPDLVGITEEQRSASIAATRYRNGEPL